MQHRRRRPPLKNMGGAVIVARDMSLGYVFAIQMYEVHSDISY